MGHDEKSVASARDELRSCDQEQQTATPDFALAELPENHGATWSPFNTRFDVVRGLRRGRDTAVDAPAIGRGSTRRRRREVPSRYQYDSSRQQNWSALAWFSRVAKSVGVEIRLDDFMWIRAVTVEDGTIVHAYEHVDTRHRLYLDAFGRAYRHVAPGGGYELAPHTRLGAVITEVLHLGGLGLGDHVRNGLLSNEIDESDATDE